MGLKIRNAKDDGSPLGTSVSVEIVIGKHADGSDQEQAIILLPGAPVPANVVPRVVEAFKAGDPHITSLYESDGQDSKGDVHPATQYIVSDPALGAVPPKNPFVETVGNGTQPFDGSNVTEPATTTETAQWAFDPITGKSLAGETTTTEIPTTPGAAAEQETLQGMQTGSTEQTGPVSAESTTASPALDYEAMSKDALEAEITRRRTEDNRIIAVHGTGANGNIKAVDLVGALQADDAAKAAE